MSRRNGVLALAATVSLVGTSARAQVPVPDPEDAPPDDVTEAEPAPPEPEPEPAPEPAAVDPAPVAEAPVAIPPPVEPPAAAPPPDETGFAFGSYGRVLAGSDLRGGTPQKVAVVAYAPRIVEPSYVETDLYYRWVTPSGARVRTATTLAFGDDLFHYTGEFDARPTLRNLFLEARLPSGLTLWGGSRMYRGDDVYLLDWWPLDNLNTVGAGASLRAGDLDVALHAGVNRLLDPFQYQTADVADPEFGAREVTVLDRQRLIASLGTTYFVHLPGELEGKVKVYGEVHSLPSGERRRADDTLEDLPSDWGALAGAQLGLWGFGERHSHVNVFARWASGLAAFDELAAPSGLARDNTAAGAQELVFGVGAAYSLPYGHVILGAYSRKFADADASVRDRDDGWEYAVDVRPQFRVVGDLLAGVDLSYQARFPQGLSPTTLLAADPAVVQIAPMLVYAPMGAAAYDRPQLRLVWRIAQLNEAALDLYAEDDPRRDHATVHFLGVQVEWWFNSTIR